MHSHSTPSIFQTTTNVVILSLGLLFGLGVIGVSIQQAAVTLKEYERSVTVKGLAEQEFPADTVIWPIQYTVTGNDLPDLLATIETQTKWVEVFLAQQRIPLIDISHSAPIMTDKKAQQYNDTGNIEYRYLVTQTLTVHSHQVDLVRQAMSAIGELGKKGMILNQDPYQRPATYMFTQLNDIKPMMVEQATQHARKVAEKFAHDSKSTLGKIKKASQGQFSISERNQNTPYIKKVRVVSTIEYYLSD
ncbi:SIMPL domain-containing protein [Vibrio artabrorum]|uniref:SIMPL domain-containing protein n=1 Tax=Vibrio artabrorum TaxID=446374 RepID=UPI00354C7438